jgi:hypothetical protein
MSAERVLVEHSELAGVLVGGGEADVTEATFIDLTVRDAPLSVLDVGYGLWVGTSVVDVTRASFLDLRRVGILAHGEAAVTLEDVTVRGTLVDDGDWGVGIAALDGAVVDVSRAILEENETHGALVQESCLNLSDAVIRDTPGTSLGKWGRGLEVNWGSEVELTRARLERCLRASLLAFDDETNVSCSNVVISETMESPCAEPPCAGGAGGSGAISLYGAHIGMSESIITENALAGVILAEGGTMDLEDSEISRNLIGASVQTEGFDWNRLLDNVIFRDNERDFDSTSLPVPEPALPPEWLGE